MSLDAIISSKSKESRAKKDSVSVRRRHLIPYLLYLCL